MHFLDSQPIEKTRPGHHVQSIHLKTHEQNQDLSPVEIISTYLAVTAEIRRGSSLLFISNTV